MSIYLGTTPIADTGSSKATTSLSNLTSTGKNIANWSNNVTNCITEIPQDIKLELNNGTLTLKAGSKVYVPNGFETGGTTPKFDVVIVEDDFTLTQTENGVYLISISANGLFIASASIDKISSGSSDALSGQTYHTWYDTTNNLIKRYRASGSTVDHYESFPIAQYTTSNGAITSIDQVFNGFGYIGSTVFALPGVKGLIPNGRNADGTLKNIEKVFNRVAINILEAGRTGEFYFIITTWASGLGSWANKLNTYYDEKNNSIISGNTEYIGNFALVATYTASSGVITSFTPKTAFHALDYNDSSTISGWSMPSSKYINLTLGASGATYTAPANGYITLQKQVTGTGQFISIYTLATDTHTRTGYRVYSSANGQFLLTTLPVKKGETVTVTYNSTSTTGLYFRFIYAEGEN